MKALVYDGPGRRAWIERPRPEITAATDAIVRVDAVTICGTDLHILKGDVRPWNAAGCSGTRRWARSWKWDRR